MTSCSLKPVGRARNVTRQLLAEGADARSPFRPFLRTSQFGDTEIIGCLLDHGADVNERDETGTALIWAARETTSAVVECLLERGADPNLQSASDKAHAKDIACTASMVAVLRGCLGMVRVLLDYGADASAINGARATVLTQARRSGSLEIVQLLKDAGARELPLEQPEL